MPKQWNEQCKSTQICNAWSLVLRDGDADATIVYFQCGGDTVAVSICLFAIISLSAELIFINILLN